MSGGMVSIIRIIVWVIGRVCFFVIDYDDGCGIMIDLGCHAGPID